MSYTELLREINEIPQKIHDAQTRRYDAQEIVDVAENEIRRQKHRKTRMIAELSTSFEKELLTLAAEGNLNLIKIRSAEVSRERSEEQTMDGVYLLLFENVAVLFRRMREKFECDTPWANPEQKEVILHLTEERKAVVVLGAKDPDQRWSTYLHHTHIDEEVLGDFIPDEMRTFIMSKQKEGCAVTKFCERRKFIEISKGGEYVLPNGMKITRS